MIFHNKYYMDKSEAQESVLTVDNGANVIASKCWIFEDWVDVKDANGNFAYSQQTAIEGIFEELIVPESVTTIEERAFCGHAKLRRISVLSGVTEIGKEAFKGCDQLPEVVAPRFRVSDAKRLFI